MRITTWNINGFRAAYGKGLKQWVENARPDVLCLQEIKARPDQLLPDRNGFTDYLSIWNPSERPGYSGVATFIQGDLPETQFGLGVPEFDIEGRVIRTKHPNFWLYNVYFPNGQRGQDRVEYKLNFYKCLLTICDGLHANHENIIITGDFNTAHQEIDLAHPKQNSTTSGFLPEERAWLDIYLQHGFVDAYRRLYPQRVEYTWWTYISNARSRNVGWRLDYFLVSEQLMNRVQDVIIDNSGMGSDHCPVTLVID